MDKLALNDRICCRTEVVGLALTAPVLRTRRLTLRRTTRGPPVTAEPTNETYLDRHFGKLADDVARVFIDAGRTTHDRSAEAKDAAGLKTNEVYGASFWLNLPRQVSGRLQPLLPGCVRIQPPASRYSLLVWNGTVIFPVKIMDRSAKRAESMRVRVSDLRRQLFALNPPAELDMSLLDLIEDYDETELQLRAETIADDVRDALGSSADSMMIVAYVCTADGGLQGVHVGTGALDHEGYILWSERQSLSLVDEFDLLGKPQLVVGETFTDAPTPKPALGLVEDENEATGTSDSAEPGSDGRSLRLVSATESGRPSASSPDEPSTPDGATQDPDHPTIS